VTRAIRARWVELACLLLGAALLIGIVWRIGLAALARDLGTLGWGLVPILGIESLSVLLNTLGWALAFPPGERPVGPRRLLAARLAGDGVNYLTPSATVGGELLRIRLLGPGVPLGVRWASVSVAKVGQTVGQAVFVLLGLAVALPALTGGAPWIGWLGAGTGAVLIGTGFVWLVGRGLWATLAGLARRIGLRHLVPAAWAAPGRDLDTVLARLSEPRVVACLTCFVGGWAVGAAEIYLILQWLGAPVAWQTALALETGSVLIDGILFFVPAKVGTQEGGKVVLFAALGLSPAHGLTVGVIRRIRELTYAGLGLAALGWLTAGRPPRTHAGAVLGGREP
jgi:hypothetical protein